MAKRYKSHKILRGIQRKIFFRKKLVQKNKECRCLVLLHLYYDQSWEEIYEYLKNLTPYRFDLIITATRGQIQPETIESIKTLSPKAQIISVGNKGYDLLPFFVALKDVDLDQYDIVFKLHSKSMKRPLVYIYKQLFMRREWFVNLFEGILSGRTVHKTIDVLFNQKDVGIVAAKNLIVKDPKHKANLIKKIAKKEGIDICDDYSFVAGTCFAIKASCLKPIQKMHFEEADFSTVISSRGMSFAHFLERYLCISVLLQGYSMKGNRVLLLRRLVKKPVVLLMNRFSAERLYKENIILDDEWFYWLLDNKLIFYRFIDLRFDQIMYEFYNKRIRFIDGAPYRYLKYGDVSGYEEYCNEHKAYGFPLMSRERFDNLIESINKNGYDERYVTVVNYRNTILDGQHRACILAAKRGETQPCRVLKIWNITHSAQMLFSRGK